MYANINGDQTNVLSGIPGLLTYPPYYWWEAGAMFGQLIDYWYYTNDSTYNDMVREGMLFQIGDQMNYVSCVFFTSPITSHRLREEAAQSGQCRSIQVNMSAHNPSRCRPISPKTRETTINSSGLSV